MKKFFSLAAALLAGAMSVAAQQTLYVSTTGADSNDGSLNAPFATIARAVEAVEPGGTILVHAGTYNISQRIRVPEKATSENARIKLFAFGDGEVIIDGSNMIPASQMEFKMARCMYFPYWANYWHVKGITFQNAKDSGVKVEGSYNIFEHCTFRWNNDTGLQIGMFKDWAIEETKSFPISGTPAFNPGYTYCRGNKVINCDSYENYDATVYGGGSDDGGDADGFACKLFPGSGTEFHGCRAWNNSDDNWDLYMVYHPVVIESCWGWNAAIDRNGAPTPGNGNGFKLGGGGSSGGAAFDQSTGAHLVYNCVAFNNTKKGFDQNNAYEGMYLLNNVAWGNAYNYRFPTVFKYGGMYLRNNVGFNAVTSNHEFLSANKEGSVVPNTDFNSWTTFDGCDPYKDGNKVGKTKVYAQDHSGEFVSLAEALAKAERQPDGSLPDNDFVRLVSGSKFIDAGQVIENFTPARFMTAAEAQAAGIELVELPAFSIDYNGASADMGSKEYGESTRGKLYITSGPQEQLVFAGYEIQPVTLTWGGAATDVTVEGADGLTVAKDAEQKTVTIYGKATENKTITVTTVGGETASTIVITINVSTTEPATLTCTTANASQTVFYGAAIADIVYEFGGGATSVEVKNLPEGLTYAVEGKTLTISGKPSAEGTYTVTAVGGMEPVSLSGSISLEIANKILTGDWYHIQDALESLPADLQGVVSIETGADYATVWDPAYDEKGTVPGGCTLGAVNVERDGALVWTLPSLLELKANVHFTGGRYLQIKWQVEGEAEHTWTSEKLKKATLTAWDLMQQAGIPQTPKPITVKFVNDGTQNNGGIRVYDFFVKVYAENGESGVKAPAADRPFSIYPTDGAIIVNLDGIAGMRLYDLSGRTVSESLRSQTLPLEGVHGVYLLQILTTDGESIVKKIVLK